MDVNHHLLLSFCFRNSVAIKIIMILLKQIIFGIQINWLNALYITFELVSDWDNNIILNAIYCEI